MADELGVQGQGQGLERKADDRSLGVVRREDLELVRSGFNQKRAGVVASGQSRMDQIEFLGIRIPEQ